MNNGKEKKVLYNLRQLGIIGVINRSQQDIKDNKSIKDALKDEVKLPAYMRTEKDRDKISFYYNK